MADEEYSKKLESLQQYIPFLNNMIAQLKDPRKKNREQQLAKMVSLHSMITDKKKKLKLETLIKCEDVILKLYDKVKSGSTSQVGSRLSPSGAPGMPPKSHILSPITPSSPSPPRDIPRTKPVVIPTEKIPDRSERDSRMCPPSSSYKSRVDIYSSAADSLKSSFTKASVFDRLGKKGPDMSKPPISMEDLEALQRDVITERMSLNELTDLRARLQKQLKSSDDGESPINTTVRNTTILTKKAVEKTEQKQPDVKSKSVEVKPSAVAKPSSVPTKPVKVIKEASSIFGSTLSSIDNQILEGASKTKDKERRNSIGDKSKERRSSKDEKKECSGHRSSKDKDKTEKKNRDKKEGEKKPRDEKSKDRKDDTKDKDRKKSESGKKEQDKKKEDVKCKEDKDKKDDNKKDESVKPKSDKPDSPGAPPVYKRLADKYNPKPRKPSLEAVTPEVSKKVADSIENSMKTSPAIPFLDTAQKSPVKTTPQLPLPIPLLSPTTSSNSTDTEIANFNRRPLLPSPQSAGGSASIPPLMGEPVGIPAHVSNILSNPNTTALLNSVVNQFKARPTPLLSPSTPNAYGHQPAPAVGQPHFHQPNQNFHAPQPVPPPNQNFHAPTPGPRHVQPNFHPPGPANFQQNFHPNPNQNFQQPRPVRPNFHNEMSNFQSQNQSGHFWKNPQQQPHQNFPKRSFTPIPNQFDNHGDYYHQNHQNTGLMSPQYDNSYESRPPRKLSEEGEGRYHEDWRRPSASPSPTAQRSRDSYRDPRLQRERDPRAYREDPRTSSRRDSREYERERGSFRDPRLNRSKYDRESAREPPIRSRSRESDDNSMPSGNTFASPLDSLYSGDGYRKTGKGYGVQNFKIPKIKKEEEVEEKKEVVEEVKAVEEEKEEVKVVEEAEAKEETAPEETKPEEKTVVVEETEAEAKVAESEETVASTSVSSSTECEVKASEEAPSEVMVETAEMGEISSTNDIQENQTRDEPKLDDPGQTDIINKFLKKLLENERTRAAASLFIDNVSNSLDDEKLKMVVRTVKTAAVERRPKKRVVAKKRVVKKGKLSAKLVAKKKQMMKSKLQQRKKRAAARRIRDDDDDEEEQKEEEDEKEEVEEKEEVVVSVGERIKSRKRSVVSSTPKKKVKHKTELDLLHEDIQDMFIRDGVLTATGKRMCRLLKSENETKPSPPSPEPPKRRTRGSAEKFDSKADSEKLKLMSNVRVLLPKIPADKLSEMEDESQRYSLRRSNKSAKSYAEIDSDDDKERKKEKQKEEEREREIERAKELEREEEKKREKEKAKEKEKKKVVVEEEDKRGKEEKPIESPKKVKKRAKSWASGILPKRKKKSVEEKEESGELDKSIDLVEPDKNYVSPKVWHLRAPCKLCDYVGKNITKHYRIKHPDSEVLSSRLNPKAAEDAIRASLELKLDEKEDETVLSTRRCRFVCRFCDFEMNVQPSNCYDHISTHTGEYRHLCAQCDFVSSNNKQLRLHYIKEHGTDSFSKPAFIRTKIYGHLCLECNFLQMSKKSVEDHVNVYHLGEGKKMVKIHLSVPDDDEVRKKMQKDEEKEKEKEVGAPPEEKLMEEEPEAKKVEEPKPKRRKIVEKEKIKETKETPPPKPAKKDKEIDMTVFTCNTDIQEENEKIEQERLKKMAELNESVKTNRQSLNFVDQLSNRLLQEEKEAPAPEVVTVKSEPCDDFLPEMEAEPKHEPEPVVEVAPKKPTNKVIEPPVPSTPVVQKDNTIIQGMIQKLQGILKEEKNTDGPPPLAPLLEKPVDEMKTFLNAGFLSISKLSEGLEYACRVPSCLFTTTNRAGFVSHWNEDHTRINQSFKMTKCRICQEEISATGSRTLLNNFFAHVENEHLCGIKTSFNAGLISVDKDREGCDEYYCLVRTCKFVTKLRDSFISHLAENHPGFKDLSRSTTCGICQKTIWATRENPLLRSLFAHLETEHLQDAEASTANKVLRTRRLSGDKLSCAKEESPELKEEDENPFPFKISGVMSLADESVPPLSPIKDLSPVKGPKIESVILKEAKMTLVEKAANWKCPEAFKKFLQCPRELYKCPQFFCKYCTSFRHLFEGHIKAHARVNDELASCVYCDIKTPLSHAGLHIDLRHSNCLYACSQCLYRALTREYVMVHNKVKHRETDLIISLPPKTAKTIMMSKQKQFTVKEACPAYKCGHQGCQCEFLYLNEFYTHLQNRHEGMMACGGHHAQQGKCHFQCLLFDNMIEHWRLHGCYNFHCLLCKVGCMEMYAMLEHYSLTHPNLEPMVVDRRNSPVDSQVYCYGEEAFAKIKYLGEELLESVNVHQYTIVNAENKIEGKRITPEPPKNVTLVPLSIIQPNSAENKKIIAIIPNTRVELSPKPVQIFTSVAKETPPAAPSPTFVFASIPNADVVKEKEVPKDDPVVEDSDISADPLSLDGELGGGANASGDESDSQDVPECSSDLKSFGLIGYQLYRCAFCDISFSNSRDFKTHCMHSKQCREDTNSLKQFRCVHCERLFKNPHGLLEHIQYHGQLRFGCSLCVKKFPSSFSLKLHMRSKHNVTNTITTPVVPNKNNMERDEFVLRPVPVVESESGKESSTPSTMGHRTIYGPDEIEHLPKRYIFNSDVKCALCPYSTKVRTNLVRHLQFHSSEKSVPDIAPVNPVPCLDKNERMFDKMTNLAISSIAGASTSRMGGVKVEAKGVKEELTQVPAYVPSHRRYVCCAEGCNYLCLEESNLRHHLHALHAQEPSFTCAHCKTNLKTDVEGFLKHLKLHDLHLYKCSGCSFVSNLRHKVDKHSTDRHPEKKAHTITIRALEAEIVNVDQSGTGTGTGSSEAPPTSNIKWTKPWHCGMCKYRCAAKSDILTHIFNKHDINTQFKCTLCSYKTDEKHTFEVHFKENHPDNDIDIIHVYYKSEGGASASSNQKQFDTTPLWQRDRPRVRHIRGILFEETSPQKQTKKVGGRGPSTSTPSTSTASTNLDLAIEAVAKGTDDVSKVDKEVKEREKTDESVIIIDDEEDDVDIEKMEESGGNELCIDVEMGEGPGEVKVETEKSLLSEDLLIKKYGRLCPPGPRAFKCPFCSKFRTKRVAVFVYHLLAELKCHRFKCNLCDFSTVTFDSMVPHCQSKHERVTATNVTETPIDRTIEYWLQLLIRYQSKGLMTQSPPPGAGEESSSPTCKTQCEYCKKWFKNIHFVKDHEVLHWANHTFTCGHCLSEHRTMDEVFQHTFLTHPTFEVCLKTDGPYVGKVLPTLKTPPLLTNPQAVSKEKEVWITEYACAYCSEKESSMEGLQRHVDDFHPGEEFTYKAVTRTKVEVMYCCNYCHERGSEQFLKQHHQDNHESSKFSIYQFICLECSSTFLNIKDLRAHFSKSHVGKKLTYSCVENKLGGATDQYCCLKCPFRSCSIGGMRGHLRKHLRPIDCHICGATFIYPTEGRAHHNKEHIHSAEQVEENKDRLREYEDMIQQIVANKEKEKGKSGVPPAPAPAPRKMLARKSTGAPFIRDTSSKKDDSELTFEVNKTKMSQEESNILTIFPVKDCEEEDEEGES